MTRTTRYAASLAVAIAAILATACENDGVSAPTDGLITVTASPTTISIVPPAQEGSAVITARVRDKNGFPAEDVSVYFSPTAGTLTAPTGASGSSLFVRTNANGVANVTLTLSAQGPSSVEVTAAAGAINGKVTVATAVGSLCDDNRPPVAVIAGPASVPLSGAAGTEVTVTLDGTPSTDEEGAIASWTFSCGSTAAPVPVPDMLGAMVECTYTVQATSRTYQATLIVKDTGTGAANPDGSYPCQKISSQVAVSVVVAPTIATAP